MIHIKALSNKIFEKHYSDEKFNHYDYAAFISILDPDNKKKV